MLDKRPTRDELLDEMLRKGFQASDRGDFAAALDWYLLAAKEGSAHGAMSAAELYASKTMSDPYKTIHLYKQALSGGITGAREGLKRTLINHLKWAVVCAIIMSAAFSSEAFLFLREPKYSYVHLIIALIFGFFAVISLGTIIYNGFLAVRRG